ncbi:HTH-type transcriptional regulator GltR [Paenibacillus plantiphilus]|uniref:HTH-type transcriptional regulator GltR n=1 Tax=Paenibacillus plantiphilus TaxID=2905650 RepID=A0ABN8G9E8_9BACL|nr:LysR family transcriptional regulator [Paenibacillus plantiphilus]CAH1203639.1 HTH-type transcriptional regulator GltR [Paenibacillus plantiphilus]
MNLENIEAFVYINHYGSFNKAAEVLYLSQPSVTARIQSLERELNCKLFDRLGKGIQITEEGKRFLPYAQQILMTYQKGKLHITQNKSLPEELRIGCTASVSNYTIPELIPRLKQKFPNIHYKLLTGTTDDIIGKVVNKEVDIGFVRNVNHPNLQSIKFYEDPICLYVYEGHPFLTEDNLSIEDIAAQPLVFFECGALDWLRVHRIFGSLDRPPNIQFLTDNSETAKKLVLQKAGISFLPSLSVKEETRDGRLVPIRLPETDGISLQTNIVSCHGKHHSFIEAIIDLGKILHAH